MINDFTECEACNSKPGSPALCSSCFNNRTVIAQQRDRIDQLERLIRIIQSVAAVPVRERTVER